MANLRGNSLQSRQPEQQKRKWGDSSRIAKWMWKPGQSGNPNGRPKKKPITDRYLEALETPLPDEPRQKLGLPRGATVGDAIARRMVIRAIDGGMDGVPATKEIREATEGRAPIAMDINMNVTSTLAQRLAEARKRIGKK